MTGRLRIHKLGGTSVGDAARIQQAARLLAEARQETSIVAVSSAMAGVTNGLLAAAEQAAAGRGAGAVELAADCLAMHRRVRSELGVEQGQGVTRDLEELEGELCELLRSVAIVGELTPRTRDRIVATGEKLCVRLLAEALQGLGVAAEAVDADTFLETDDRFGQAGPLHEVIDRTAPARLGPLLEEGCIPVVTGFCGRAPDGATTTLGRGGSDLTATLLAAALRAEEVTIWTDVAGVFTADPRIVPECRVIPQLNFREAAELSYYGAKVLHQRTMIPVATRGIPVRTRSSFEPELHGTTVDGRFTPGSHPVKAISAIGGQCLLSVEGKGMAGVPGIAARLFQCLAARRISVTMISQSSSESSITLAVSESDATAAEAALKREFRPDISRGDVEEVTVRRHVSLVAAVGLGMAHTPGVAARLFGAVARKGANVLAIAQGSSELNISVAVDTRDREEAVRAIHGEFGLHRIDTGEVSSQRLDVLLLGCGSIGRALGDLILQRNAEVFRRFDLSPRIVALADRSGFALRPTGFEADELRALFQAKKEGRVVADSEGGRSASDVADMVRTALEYRLARPVLVDVSDSEESGSAFREAFRLGCDVVTANKKPLAGPFRDFRTLLDEAEAAGRLIRAEATVGAGLPVVDTLQMLLDTGDRLHRIEGCLSGTLGFIMSRLEEGEPLSEAVGEAVRRGYTEPDPAVDLSGMDVARKAVILGRMSGLAAEDRPVGLEPLASVETGDADLLARVRDLDAGMAERVAAARSRGMCLRYVASISPDGLSIGPREVPQDSALGMLKGSDNMVVFHSDRYRDRPLVVAGPGAGIDVTAMGVLSDVLRIAAERR